MTYKEVSDADVVNALIPLANIERIKIMRHLSQGAKYFNDLLRITALTHSPLRFHLKVLLKTAYIEQERPRGRYTLTPLGRSILRMAEELARQTQNYITSTPESELQRIIQTERHRVPINELM